MATDILALIDSQLKDSVSSWPKEADIRSAQFERILERFRIDIPAAIETAYAMLEQFELKTTMVYNNQGKATAVTKRQLLRLLQESPYRLELIAFNTLTELEDASDTMEAESILGFFQDRRTRTHP